LPGFPLRSIQQLRPSVVFFDRFSSWKTESITPFLRERLRERRNSSAASDNSVFEWDHRAATFASRGVQRHHRGNKLALIGDCNADFISLFDLGSDSSIVVRSGRTNGSHRSDSSHPRE